jgi:phage terminase large subunit-like protein
VKRDSGGAKGQRRVSDGFKGKCEEISALDGGINRDMNSQTASGRRNGTSPDMVWQYFFCHPRRFLDHVLCIGQAR